MKVNLSDGLFLNIAINSFYLCEQMSLFHLQKNVAMPSSSLHNKHKHAGPCLSSNVSQSDYSVKNVHKECA